MAFRKKGLCLLLGLIGIGTAAMGQDKQIVVQAVDGRNGKPIANQHMLVFGGDSTEAVRQQKNQYELTTDKDGLATLTLVPGTQWLQVWMDWHVLCQSEHNSKNFPVKDILVSGLSTPNNCSSVSEKAAPGHLVVFARPERFWEKMRH
jgi:hypothetical protein